jgi:hypothetical protein
MRIGTYVEVAKDEQPTGIGLHVQNLVQALAEIEGRMSISSTIQAIFS